MPSGKKKSSLFQAQSGKLDKEEMVWFFMAC